MEEIRVRKQFLGIPHHLFDRAGNDVELLVSRRRRQFLRPLFDDRVARVRPRVDRVAEAHDLVLAAQHLVQACRRFLCTAEFFDQLHGRFVRAAVQGATQRADRAGDAGMHVRQGRRTDPRGEGRRIELVLRIQDQGNIHDPLMQFGRRFAVQQVQKVTRDRLVGGLGINAQAVVAEAVPIIDDRRQRRDEPVRDCLLLFETGFRLNVAQHGTAGAHDIHRMGALGDALQHLPQRLRQTSQPFEFIAICGQLARRGQFAAQDQIGHFLEGRLPREFRNVVAAIGQTRTGFAHGAQRGLPGNLATQACATQYLYLLGHG